MTPEQKKELLLYWQLAVEGMDVYDIPREYGYTSVNIQGKYDRFTTFVKEYLEKLGYGCDTGIAHIDSDDTWQKFPECELGEFYDEWWDDAMLVGDDMLEAEDCDLPKKYKPTKTDRKIVHDSIIPLYRALKESYDRRPWYHWIFYHAQYTAERDSIKALKGFMMSVNKESSEAVDKALAAYCKEVEGSGTSYNERKQMIAAKRAEKRNAVYGNPRNTDLNQHLQNTDEPIVFNPNEQSKGIGNINARNILDGEEITEFDKMVNQIPEGEEFPDIGHLNKVVFTKETPEINKVFSNDNKKEPVIQDEQSEDSVIMVGDLLKEIEPFDNRMPMDINQDEINGNESSLEYSQEISGDDDDIVVEDVKDIKEINI